MPPNQHNHPEYAQPVLRGASPASSVGTSYGLDQTSFSDCEDQLSQVAFERKCEEEIGLGFPSFEEVTANMTPFLERPAPGSHEERGKHVLCPDSNLSVLTFHAIVRFNEALAFLRREVQELEDNELFEQTLLRGSQATLEQQPGTSDIDALMRSMMVAPSVARQQQSTWNDTETTNRTWTPNGYYERSTDLPSGVKAGKRSRNGSRRNP